MVQQKYSKLIPVFYLLKLKVYETETILQN